MAKTMPAKRAIAVKAFILETATRVSKCQERLVEEVMLE
jgi:hypothetical protein